MTRAEWEDRAGFYLEANGITEFSAAEICPVGKVSGEAVLAAPSPLLILNAIKLIQGPLVFLREFEGVAPIDVNSWYRDPVYNSDPTVGGSERSLHITCAAADVNKRGWTPRRLALALHRDFPDSKLLGIGLYRTFVHVDVRGMIGRRVPARWSGAGVAKWWT